MSDGFQKPKTKSGSAGPSGLCPTLVKNPLFPLLWQPTSRIHLQDPLTRWLQKIPEFRVVQDRLAAAPRLGGRQDPTATFNMDPGDFPALVPLDGPPPALTDYKDFKLDQMEVDEGHETPDDNYRDKNKGCDTLRFEFF